MDNHFDLDRFVQAQDPVYASVLTELRGLCEDCAA